MFSKPSVAAAGVPRVQDLTAGVNDASKKVWSGSGSGTGGDGGLGIEPATKKKGTLFEWLDNAEKEKEEYEMRKQEKMNELFAKRMRQKSERELAARRAE